MKKFYIYLVITLLLLCGIMWGLAAVERYVPASIRDQAKLGEPFLFYEEPNHWGGISRVAANGEYLYVLHDDRGILCVYDLQGNYLHSYCFAERENGRSSVFTLDGTVYYQDRTHNYYTLEGGIVTDFPESSTELFRKMNQPQRQAEQAPVTAQDAVFEIRGASVWKMLADGTEVEIIRRPGWLAIFQGNTLMYIYGVCFLIVWIMGALKKKRNT